MLKIKNKYWHYLKSINIFVTTMNILIPISQETFNMFSANIDLFTDLEYEQSDV